MTVIELLARQAAEQRELSRERGVAATEAKPLVEQAATLMTSSREAVEALQAQLAEIEAALAEARQAHDHATDAHAEALGVVAAHEAEAQQAADIAESLDRIAKQMRDARPEPPHEALAATGLMVEPPKVVEPTPDEMDQLRQQWAEVEPGQPNVVRAPDEVIAAVTGALPVTAPPTPDEPAGELVATGPPDVTMPDLGPKRERLDPPPGDGTHSHAKPNDGLMSRVTGGWPVVGRRKKNDEQDGDA